MEYTNKKHKFDKRDARMLRALLVEKIRPAEIARREGISRERVRQLFKRLGVTFRPVYHVPPELAERVVSQ